MFVLVVIKKSSNHTILMTNSGELNLPVSEQLKAAIGTRELARIKQVLESVINGETLTRTTDIYALAVVVRKLKGTLEHTDTRSWKKKGKIDKNEVARLARRALEKLGEMRNITNGENSFGRKGLRRINTGDLLVKIRNGKR
jgi:hypothetical protein